MSCSNTLNIYRRTLRSYANWCTFQSHPLRSISPSSGRRKTKKCPTHRLPMPTVTSADFKLSKPSSMLMELSTKREDHRKERGKEKANTQKKTPVEGSTVRAAADFPKTSGTTNIRIRELKHGMRPKYLRYNNWDSDSDFSPNTSDWTLTAKPLETSAI
jgi:hypothetical protein